MSRRRARRAFASTHAQVTDASRDLEDELAWLACEQSRLRNAHLQQTIRAAAIEQDLRVRQVKRGELRRDGVLLFALIIIPVQLFGPTSTPQQGLFVAIVALACWAIRGGPSDAPRSGRMP